MVDDIGVETPENLRYSYLDKFQVLQGPMQLPPHKCAGCGYALVSSTDKYVDWCFDVEFYGQVALCINCFRSAANQIGYMSPDQWESVMTERSDLYGRVHELIEENMRYKDALASLGLIGVTSADSSVASVGEVEESESSDGGESGNAPVSDGGSEGDNATEPESDGQDASQGSSELYGDDTLNELIAGI